MIPLYPELDGTREFAIVKGWGINQFLAPGSRFSGNLSTTMVLSSMMMSRSKEIVAAYVAHEVELNASQAAEHWETARPVAFWTDWQGKNPDPGQETVVRVLWTPRTLYLRFECHYRELYLFSDAEPSGRRDHLWDRDVAEAFLQPDPSRERFYREFEVSPNGMWIDLDISPDGLADLRSGLQRSVFLDEKSQVWTAELAIPMGALTSNFDSNAVWRANFYRIEGTKDPRKYLAWQPTGTPQPNFHVPSAFGTLRFAPPPPQ
jgi:alpha-galactosidase